MDSIKAKIRDIPDFPKPGVIFKDLTPLIGDYATLKLTTDLLVEPFMLERITAVAGMEARGFVFGALAASALGVGFVPLRKPGKLPASTLSEKYDLEYGSTALHIHTDALGAHDRVLLVDDLIATGGTASASLRLVRQLKAHIVGCAFVVELDFLHGREKLDSCDVHSLVHY